MTAASAQPHQGPSVRLVVSSSSVCDQWRHQPVSPSPAGQSAVSSRSVRRLQPVSPPPPASQSDVTDRSVRRYWPVSPPSLAGQSAVTSRSVRHHQPVSPPSPVGSSGVGGPTSRGGGHLEQIDIRSPTEPGQWRTMARSSPFITTDQRSRILCRPLSSTLCGRHRGRVYHQFSYEYHRQPMSACLPGFATGVSDLWHPEWPAALLCQPPPHPSLDPGHRIPLQSPPNSLTGDYSGGGTGRGGGTLLTLSHWSLARSLYFLGHETEGIYFR